MNHKLKKILFVFLIFLTIATATLSFSSAAPNAVIEIEILTPGPWEVGQEVQVAIWIRNTGDNFDGTDDLTNVNIKMALPEGLKFKSSATGTSKNNFNDTTGIWKVDELKRTASGAGLGEGVKRIIITMIVTEAMSGQNIDFEAKFTSVQVGTKGSTGGEDISPSISKATASVTVNNYTANNTNSTTNQTNNATNNTNSTNGNINNNSGTNNNSNNSSSNGNGNKNTTKNESGKNGTKNNGTSVKDSKNSFKGDSGTGLSNNAKKNNKNSVSTNSSQSLVGNIPINSFDSSELKSSDTGSEAKAYEVYEPNGGKSSRSLLSGGMSSDGVPLPDNIKYWAIGITMAILVVFGYFYGRGKFRIN
ncbi:MAG: hypothetical protein ACRCVG_01815 [Methanobacteriaceae archaeon]